MDILFYKYDGDSRIINKPLNNPLTKDVNIRTDIDIYNPMLLLQDFDASYNYYLWDSRYYYVTDLRYTSNHIWMIQSHIDVLMTYKDVILASRATLIRDATHNFMQGASIPQTSKPTFRQSVFPNNPFTRNNDNYILIGMGGKT